jgi:predicted dehydrogenase
LLAAIAGGRLGTVTGVSAVASWQRSDGYYARAPWAGRRTMNGQALVDGALVNPLAHAVMQSLVVAAAAGGSPTISTVEQERFRTRPIEVEDTACLRVRLDTGLPVVVAVTLCGEEFIPGEVIVYGTAGRAVLEYPTDRLCLPGEVELRDIPGRVSMLDNLLAHRATPDFVDLVAPLHRTEPFTTVLDHATAAPPPTPVGGDWVSVIGDPPDRHVVITGVNGVVRAAAESLSLFRELGVPWAASTV